MAEPKVLRATAADAADIAALHAASWRSAYRGMLPDAFLDGPVEEDRRRLWQQRMTNPSERLVVWKAVDDGAMLGFACVFLDEDPEWGALLDNLHVTPRERSRGVGKLLLRAARQHVASVRDARMHLWVLEANVRAQAFYERHGGIRAGRRSETLAPGIEVSEVRYAWTPTPR